MRRGWVVLGGAVVVLYIGGYLVYRVKHVAVWPVDDRAYVMFGSRVAWYLFRPVSRLDAAATGMRFHLGPHRPPPETARELVDRAIVAAGGAERLAALKSFEWRGRAEAAIGAHCTSLARGGCSPPTAPSSPRRSKVSPGGRRGA
jgi:hypothetical protein